MPSTPEELCNFRYTHPPRVDAQYDVQEVGGKFVYGTAEAKFAFKKTMNDPSSTGPFTSVMNYLKYDSSNSDTGIALSTMSTSVRSALFALQAYTTNAADIFQNPFELVNGEYTYKRRLSTSAAAAYYESFVDYSDLQPLRVCVLDSRAASITGIPETTDPYVQYRYIGTPVYYSALLYYHPSCNGLNSFCDLKNLYFGEEKVSKPIPSLAIISNAETYSDADCSGYRENNVGP
jgi:hypothetical protein